MQKVLYAANYQARRKETFARAAGRCEQMVNGKRCPRRIGMFTISRAGNAYFETLYIHHVNNDPWNPDAELVAVCSRCHMRLHRQPVAGGPAKAPARKRGYRVIAVDHLACQLQGAGLLLHQTEECRTQWQAGPFEAEAADPLSAITSAFHCLVGEVRDLRNELQEAQRALGAFSTALPEGVGQ